MVIHYTPTQVSVDYPELPVDEAPVAVNDYNQTSEDTSVTGNVITGDNQITKDDYLEATDASRNDGEAMGRMIHR